MTINIKRAVAIFIAINLCAAAVLILWRGLGFFINAQISFLCSFIIAAASMLGYKKTVKNKIGSTDAVLLDVLDKIEDPYELYDQENEKEAKKVSKLKMSVKNIKISATGYFSPYRIAGYSTLFVAFLTLVKSGYFDPLPFFMGIGLMPLWVLAYAYLSKNDY